MNPGGDAAEQMVHFYLEGVEVAAKLSGKCAEHIVALLLNILRTDTKTKGKARLNSMLKSGKELKVFTIQKKDLAKFAKEAKSYGVLYSALIDRKNKNLDGMVDIMVRQEDASKINRIVERFKLITSNPIQIKTEVKKELNKIKKDEIKEEKSKGIQTKTREESIKIQNATKPIQKESLQEENFNTAKIAQSPLSEPNLKKQNMGIDNHSNRESVRKELMEIREEEKIKKGLKAKERENKNRGAKENVPFRSNKSKGKTNKIKNGKEKQR